MTVRVVIASVLALFLCLAGEISRSTAAEKDLPAAPMTLAQGGKNGGGTFSPLHDLLGIDPDTGQFVEERAKQPDTESRRDDADADDDDAAEPASVEDRPSGADNADSGRAVDRRAAQTADDEAIRTAEGAREAVRELSERVRGGSIEELSSVFGDQFPGSRLHRVQRQLVWITAAVLMIYPLSILISEAAGWWLHHDEPGTTELDRHYRKSRLTQRVALAMVLAALIVLMSAGSLRNYWWGEPNQFTLFCVAAIGLGMVAAFLAAMLKRAAKEHEMAVMREMRRHMFEMRKELEELRKRMRRVTISSE